MENKERFEEGKRFLYALGIIKRQKENFLSDVIRAKCLYDITFLRSFFTFCFPRKSGVEVYAVDREIACFGDDKENSKKYKGRNDFQIYTSDGIYVVESKILDKDVSKYELYLSCLNIEKDHIAYIISEKNPQFMVLKKKLESDCINCLCWETFVDKIQIQYEDWALLATKVLNYDKMNLVVNKPIILGKNQQLCDFFFEEYLCSDKYDGCGGKISEWERTGAYGYSIWASVWFGILWCSLKGSFWAFAYGDGGDKKMVCLKKNLNI